MPRKPTPELIAKIREAGTSKHVSQRLWAAAHPHAPTDMLDNMVVNYLQLAARLNMWYTNATERENSFSVRWPALSAVANPNLSPQQLLRVLLDPDNKDLGERATANPAITAKMIDTVFQYYPHPTQVTIALLSHPKCPKGHLEKHVRTAARANIMEAAALNPNLPPDLQIKVLSSSNPKACKRLARNPNLHPQVLARMCRTMSGPVLHALIMAGYTNPELIHNARESGIGYVMGALIKKGLATDEDIANALASGTAVARAAVARVTDDADTLTQLAAAGSSSVTLRRAVAANPATPEEAHVAAYLVGAPLNER